LNINFTVKSIKIKNFRGIAEGKLNEFTGINILVGRNATGKSTILEALYIALNPEGVDFIVKRRGWFGLTALDGLFYRNSRKFSITITFSDKSLQKTSIEIAIPVSTDLRTLKDRGLNVKNIRSLFVSGEGKLSTRSRFYIDDKGQVGRVILGSRESILPWHVAFIDWNAVLSYGEPEEAYTYMIDVGGFEAKNHVVEVLRERLKGLATIEPLKKDDKVILYAVFKDYAVPFYLLGDGIRYTLVYLMLLSACKKSFLMLEEPELHTHPGLLELTAKGIVESYVKRGNQIFFSTHSLELIDMVLNEAVNRELRSDEVKVYRLTLLNGSLHSRTYTLEESAKLRKELEYDLRG